MSTLPDLRAAFNVLDGVAAMQETARDPVLLLLTWADLWRRLLRLRLEVRIQLAVPMEHKHGLKSRGYGKARGVGEVPTYDGDAPEPPPPLRELHTGVQGEGAALAEPRKDNSSTGQAKGQHLVFDK
jgi:hypothetical protein